MCSFLNLGFTYSVSTHSSYATWTLPKRALSTTTLKSKLVCGMKSVNWKTISIFNYANDTITILFIDKSTTVSAFIRFLQNPGNSLTWLRMLRAYWTSFCCFLLLYLLLLFVSYNNNKMVQERNVSKTKICPHSLMSYYQYIW